MRSATPRDDANAKSSQRLRSRFVRGALAEGGAVWPGTRVTLVNVQEDDKPAYLHHHLLTNDARLAAAESSVMGRRGCAVIVYDATLGGVGSAFRDSER